MVSNDTANRYSSVIIVIPITTSLAHVYPFEVALVAGDGGLNKDGVLKVNQIKTIDKTRLAGQPLGVVLSQDLLDQVAAAIKIHLDIA